MEVIVDTREQQPFEFETYSRINCHRDKLEVGDYSVAAFDQPGDDYSIIVERKENCSEFLRNLGANWKRFEKELAIMSQYRTKIITVCEPKKFEQLYSKGYSQLHPNFAEAQLLKILINYGIPTYFFRSRDDCENFIYRLFLKNEQEANDS